MRAVMSTSRLDLESWLHAGGDPNAVDDRGRTLLMLAVSRKDFAGMQLLLQYGADCDRQQRQGATAVALAAMMGSVDAVRILLAAGASAEISDVRGFTPMDYASLKASASQAGPDHAMYAEVCAVFAQYNLLLQQAKRRAKSKGAKSKGSKTNNGANEAAPLAADGRGGPFGGATHPMDGAQAGAAPPIIPQLPMDYHPVLPSGLGDAASVPFAPEPQPLVRPQARPPPLPASGAGAPPTEARPPMAPLGTAQAPVSQPRHRGQPSRNPVGSKSPTGAEALPPAPPLSRPPDAKGATASKPPPPAAPPPRPPPATTAQTAAVANPTNAVTAPLGPTLSGMSTGSASGHLGMSGSDVMSALNQLCALDERLNISLSGSDKSSPAQSRHNSIGQWVDGVLGSGGGSSSGVKASSLGTSSSELKPPLGNSLGNSQDLDSKSALQQLLSPSSGEDSGPADRPRGRHERFPVNAGANGDRMRSWHDAA